MSNEWGPNKATRDKMVAPSAGSERCTRLVGTNPCGLHERDLIHHKDKARTQGFGEDMFPDSEFHEFVGHSAPESGKEGETSGSILTVKNRATATSGDVRTDSPDPEPEQVKDGYSPAQTLTPSPAQGAVERHARIRKGLNLDGMVHIPEWAQVTDPEVEKFLDWLPLKLGHDGPEVRRRLLKLIEIEGTSAARVTAAKDADIARLKDDWEIFMRESNGKQWPTILSELEEAQAEVERLRRALNNIHGWLVCAAVASTEDFMSGVIDMELTARAALSPETDGGGK